MSKVKIKVITIGHLPIHLDIKKIKSWKSSVFEIVGDIEKLSLRCDSDGDNWEFSDELVREQLPRNFEADFMIAITNVPLEKNWYARRPGGNQVVVTFHQIKEILASEHIPLENVVYRVLYAVTLLYKRSDDKIPDYGERPGFTHDETRGCLFDMNGNKQDIAESCNHPILCDECQERLRKERVAEDLIESIRREIKGIKKDLYYLMMDYVKQHPLWSLFLSSVFAIFLGIVGSLIASVIYTKLTHQ